MAQEPIEPIEPQKPSQYKEIDFLASIDKSLASIKKSVSFFVWLAVIAIILQSCNAVLSF